MANRPTRNRSHVNYNTAKGGTGTPAWMGKKRPHENVDKESPVPAHVVQEEGGTNATEQHTAVAAAKRARTGSKDAGSSKNARARAVSATTDEDLPLSERLENQKQDRNCSTAGKSGGQEPAKNKRTSKAKIRDTAGAEDPHQLPDRSKSHGTSGRGQQQEDKWAAAPGKGAEPKPSKRARKSSSANSPKSNSGKKTGTMGQRQHSAVQKLLSTGKQAAGIAEAKSDKGSKHEEKPKRSSTSVSAAAAKEQQQKSNPQTAADKPAASLPAVAKTKGKSQATSRSASAGRTRSNSNSGKDEHSSDAAAALEARVAEGSHAAVAAAAASAAPARARARKQSSSAKGAVATAAEAAATKEEHQDGATAASKQLSGTAAVAALTAHNHAATAGAGSSAATSSSGKILKNSKGQTAAAVGNALVAAPAAAAAPTTPAAAAQLAATAPAAGAVVVPAVASDAAGRSNIADLGALEFSRLQAEYRRLHAMYDELKAQKIQEMEGLVQEHDSYLAKMGEEARQLAEYWRKEADMQRQSAASVRAPETARQIKQLQDSKLAADAAVLEKEKAMLQLQSEMAELKRKFIIASNTPNTVEAGIQAAPTMQEAAMSPLTAGAAAAVLQAAHQMPVPSGCQFGSVQFPTPAVLADTPGIGTQYPTPGVDLNGAAAEANAAVNANGTVAAAAEGTVSLQQDAGAGTGSSTLGTDAMQLGQKLADSSRAVAQRATLDQVAAAEAVNAAAAVALPACASLQSGPGGSNGSPKTVRKQLQLSENGSGQQRVQGSRSSSPVRGLVVGVPARHGLVSAAVGVAARDAGNYAQYNTPGGINAFMFSSSDAVAAEAQGTGIVAAGTMVVAAGTGIVPAAAYSTPGGINSFMFAAVPGGNAAAAQTGARNIPGAAAAGDGVFAFQNLAGDVGSVHCVLDPLGQQDLQHQDVGLQQPWQLEADALGGSGGGAGNGDGLQNSDNGSFVVGNNRVVAVQQAARQLGWLSRPGALHTPPAAPHSTPMGPAQAGLTPVGMQQQQTPASSAGSQMRLQVRKQQMQQLRAALREGLSSMLVPAAEGAAVQKPVVAAATAGDATDRTVNRGAETGVPQPYSARQDAAAGGAAAAAGDNGAAAPRAAGMQLPVNASGRHSIVSQGGLPGTPAAGGVMAPTTTPACTPDAAVAAVGHVPADKLTAALVSLAASHVMLQGSDAPASTPKSDTMQQAGQGDVAVQYVTATAARADSVAARLAAAGQTAAVGGGTNDIEAGITGMFSPPAAAVARAIGTVVNLIGTGAAAAGHGTTAGGALQTRPLVAGAVVDDTPISAARPRAGSQTQSARQIGAALNGASSSGRRTPASATRHMLPLMYLCDFDPQFLDNGGIQYRHSATGFTFRLGPAASTMTALTPQASRLTGPEDSGEPSEGWDGCFNYSEEEQDDDNAFEEVSFEPVAMGTAEAALPGFLKEPITFATSEKPQFMKLLFQALADASKAAVITAQRQHGKSKAGRGRRHSKPQQDQPHEPADKVQEGKENTTAAAHKAAKDGKLVGQTAGAAVAGLPSAVGACTHIT